MPQAKNKGSVGIPETQKYAVREAYTKHLKSNPRSIWSTKISALWKQLELKTSAHAAKVNVVKRLEEYVNYERTINPKYEEPWDNNIYKMVLKDGVAPYRTILKKDVINGVYSNSGPKGRLALTGENTSKAQDIEYVKEIERFTQLEDLKEFANRPDLNWIAENEQRVLYAIMKKSQDEGLAYNTFKGYFKPVIRFLKLMMGLSHELKIKWSVLQEPLTHLEKFSVGMNTPDITTMYYPDLLELVDILEEKGKTNFSSHMDFIALACFVWDYPSRTDKFATFIIDDIKNATGKKTYLVVKNNQMSQWIFRENIKDRTRNRRGTSGDDIDYENLETLRFLEKGNTNDPYNLMGLGERLDEAIKSSLDKYPRTSLFVRKTDKKTPVSKSTVATWLRNILPDPSLGAKFNKDRNINVDLLRHSFATHWYRSVDRNMDRKIAFGMLTSLQKLDDYYFKYIRTPEQRVAVKLEPSQADLNAVNVGTTQNPIQINNRQGNNIPAQALDLDVQNNRIVIKQEPRDNDDAPAARGGVQQVILVQNNRNTERHNKWKGNGGQRNNEYIQKKIDRDRSYVTYAKRYVRELNQGMKLWETVTDVTISRYQIYQEGDTFKTRLAE